MLKSMLLLFPCVPITARSNRRISPLTRGEFFSPLVTNDMSVINKNTSVLMNNMPLLMNKVPLFTLIAPPSVCFSDFFLHRIVKNAIDVTISS